MRIIVGIITILLVLNGAVAQIYKYDDIVFYPNGTQYINISKLYVDSNNLKEALRGEVLEVRIIYKNQSFLIIQFDRNITFDLPVENINLSINISATKIDRETWKVKYTVVNNYDREIPINISFPPGYNLKNISTTVPGNSPIHIYLYKTSSSNTLYFGDSYISYRIPSKIEIIYTASVPISIEKSNRILNNSIKWIANYSIRNNINISLKANISLWVDINNKSISLGNISNITIPPNSTYVVIRSIYSDEAPIFYSSVYIWNRTEGKIVMIPLLRTNNTYIVGMAKVKGQTFHYSPAIVPDERRKKPVEEKEEKSPEETKEEKKPPEGGEEEKPKEGEEREGEKEKEKKRFYLIKKTNNPKDIAVLSLSVFILNILVLPLLPVYLPPNIVGNSRALIHTYRSIGRIYIPDGIKLEGPLPLNIFVVHPNDYLVSIISRSFDIPVNSAKALAIAIEHGGVLKTTDKKTYKIALKLGIDVEYVE